MRHKNALKHFNSAGFRSRPLPLSCPVEELTLSLHREAAVSVRQANKESAAQASDLFLRVSVKQHFLIKSNEVSCRP